MSVWYSSHRKDKIINNVLEIEKDVIGEIDNISTLKKVSKRIAERYQGNIKIEINCSQANTSVKVNITYYDI